MVTVLKLGGSAITEKDTPETVDREAIDRASDAVATALSGADLHSLVLVHGGGSFGHHHAARHGVSTTEGSRDVAALTGIHRAMGDLNRVVVDALQDRGVGALPVRPLSVAARQDDLAFPPDSVETMLAEGFVPVLHGDVVVDAGKGATILSGDEIVVALAGALGADRVGLCSTVPGVLDAEGTVIDEITAYEQVASALGDSDATDVTGGMAAKVRDDCQRTIIPARPAQAPLRVSIDAETRRNLFVGTCPLSDV
ncbi:acetylglutamate kinase [Halobacteriales archaeon QH_6_66_25]|nr:MAG: acetylglutamate kinase [Halobacteriales archaeon QH_6_66_25]